MSGILAFSEQMYYNIDVNEKSGFQPDRQAPKHIS